jgi:Glycosyl hydrolase family 1
VTIAVGATVDANSFAELAADERVDDCIAAAADLGLGMLRFGVPWALMEPRAGGIDGGIVEQHRAAAETCREHGIEPWFTLLQSAVPIWFDNEGGFTDARMAGRFWPRWVEQCAAAFGDVAAGWVPFEAPFALANRLVPDNPAVHGELMDTLVVAWRDAWRILRGGPPVSTSLDVAVVRPADETIPAEEAARREDHLRWRTWFQALQDGAITIPGRADRELADLAGACDIVGLALRGDVETVLYRAAELAGEISHGVPLAMTFRTTVGSDAQRAETVSAMWRSARHAVDEVSLRHAAYAPLRGHGGLLGDAGETTAAGRAWVAGAPQPPPAAQ